MPYLEIFRTLPVWFQMFVLLVPSISALSAAIGLILNFIQSNRTNAQSRATLVAETLKGFTEDEEIQKAFYAIEYGKFRYVSDDFHMSEEEREIDKLLRHFANLALLWESGLLTLKDIAPIQYYLLRVMKNQEIIKYLKFIENFSAKTNNGRHPYTVLKEICNHLSHGDNYI